MPHRPALPRGRDQRRFNGGPGATGRSYSDRPTLEASIRAKLFALPNETVVHTGHGEDTTIGTEKNALGTFGVGYAWIDPMPDDDEVLT